MLIFNTITARSTKLLPYAEFEEELDSKEYYRIQSYPAFLAEEYLILLLLSRKTLLLLPLSQL